jgi:phosphoribosyl 1,2-cyclic phosphodiesterase
MELKVLGSSSKGNCYLLTSSTGETLIIEAGVKIQQVKQALDWKMSGIVGCIVTHRHNDHAGYIEDYMACGIRCLALQDVFEAHKDNKFSHFGKLIVPMRGYIVGGFRIYVLPVCHDVPCVGFIIDHPEMGKLLFLTDTMMFEYAFPKGIKHVMIEANYSDDILEENILSGAVLPSMRARLLHSHMELRTTIDTLCDNDLSGVLNVILLHLSAQNSNPQRFQREVADACHCITHVAKPKFTLWLSNGEPY